jgi:hypothetical protein
VVTVTNGAQSRYGGKEFAVNMVIPGILNLTERLRRIPAAGMPGWGSSMR